MEDWDMQVKIKKVLQGSILDIGGGGEGVIGRIYQGQVTAIDNRQEELDEAPDGFKKLCMDASALSFADASFDHVTAFYAFLYISRELRERVIQETVRVLRPGGTYEIWDAEVESAYPEAFEVELDIDAAGWPIHVTYGMIKKNAAQLCEDYIRLCAAAGLSLQKQENNSGQFYLQFVRM